MNGEKDAVVSSMQELQPCSLLTGGRKCATLSSQMIGPTAVAFCCLQLLADVACCKKVEAVKWSLLFCGASDGGSFQ